MPRSQEREKSRGRLLIIDDDEAVLKSIGEYFERVGFEVNRAATGKDGLEAFRTWRPDVSIVDLRLPDMDGMQILEAMRRERAAVLLLTGYGDIPTAVRAMQLGAENFLTKPVDMPHLVAAVDRALDKVELRRENLRLHARLKPSVWRQVARGLTFAGFVTVAGLAGRWIGSLGKEERTVPRIAPTDEPVMQNLPVIPPGAVQPPRPAAGTNPTTPTDTQP